MFQVFLLIFVIDLLIVADTIEEHEISLKVIKRAKELNIKFNQNKIYSNEI